MDSLRKNLPSYFSSLRQWAGDLGLIGQSTISLRELIPFARAPQTYEITVETGTVENAETDDDIFITIFGSRATLSEQELDNDEDNFERGKRDVFQLTGSHLGQLQKIRIWRDRNFLSSAWYLKQITIRKVSTNQTWFFPCHRWLSPFPNDAADCATDLIISVNGPAIPNPDVKHNCVGPSQTATPSSSGTVSPAPRASRVQLYNCHVDRFDLHIWLFDLTAGTREEVGSLAAQHDSSGFCPGSGMAPVDFELKKDHLYRIIAVDPQNQNCGANNPEILGCQRWQYQLVGDPQAGIHSASID